MSASGSELFSLSDKTILITGGTRGIGQAISLRFARAGATVIANYLRDEKAAENLKAIATEESLAIALCRADLTSERGLEQLERSLEERGPHLSGLVHCAATGIHRPIEELTERHFDWTFNLNVRAFFKLIKLLLGRFSKGSSIVAVSSWGALRALPCYSLVGSSKGALEALGAPPRRRTGSARHPRQHSNGWGCTHRCLESDAEQRSAHRGDHPSHPGRAFGHRRGSRVWGPIPLLRCGFRNHRPNPCP